MKSLVFQIEYECRFAEYEYDSEEGDLRSPELLGTTVSDMPGDPRKTKTVEHALRQLTLEPGKHTISVRNKGKNAESREFCAGL